MTRRPHSLPRSEAAGPDAIYVNPRNEEELASQISAVLSSQLMKEKMINSSKLFVKQFNPEEIAQKMNFIYRMPD